MKSTLIKTLFNKHIKQQLSVSDLNYKNHLIYHEINAGLLKGFCFTSSAFSAGQFEIIAFVMPLYVPTDFIILSFGYPLKTPDKRQWWEYNENNLEQLGTELAVAMNHADKDFLAKIYDAECFYKYYKSNRKLTLRHFEAVSYSAAYAELKAADNELNSYRYWLKKSEEIKFDWAQQIYSNTEKLLHDDKKAILAEWEMETRKALRL